MISTRSFQYFVTFFIHTQINYSIMTTACFIDVRTSIQEKKDHHTGKKRSVVFYSSSLKTRTESSFSEEILHQTHDVPSNPSLFK